MKELFDHHEDMNTNTACHLRGSRAEGADDNFDKQKTYQETSIHRNRITKSNYSHSISPRKADSHVPNSMNRSRNAGRQTLQNLKNNSKIKQGNSSTHRIKFETPILRETIKHYKVKNLIKIFVQKITQNSIYRQPVLYQPFALDQKYNSVGFNGIELNHMLSTSIFFLITFHTLFSCVLASILISFSDQLGQSAFMNGYSTFGIIICVIEILTGFTRIRQKKQYKIVKIKQIAKSYLKQNFIIDLTSLFIYAINLATQNPQVSLTYILFFIKIPGCIEKIHIIQSRIMGTFQLQHYYKLLKISMSNFVFAHVIATAMLMASKIDPNNNWLIKYHIQNTQWYEQYCWAFYWAMTTMLTVGFGDITVSNYKEAIILVVVQAFGCMTLAYNITRISSLLSDLDSKSMQKNNNINLLRKFNNKNQLEAGIYKQLVNYIEQEHNMQTKFNYQQSNTLINKLPQNLKKSFLRSVNEKSIKYLTFFKCLTNKTILSIAEKIQTKIAHPEQVICNKNQISNMIIILKQGEIGFFPHMNRQVVGLAEYGNMGKTVHSYDRSITSLDHYKKYNSTILNTIIDRFVVKQGEKTKFISLNFLDQRHKPKNYEIRSTKYSLIYQMSLNTLLNLLRAKDIDIQYYFSIRDKYNTKTEQFELVTCDICSNIGKKQTTQKHSADSSQHSKYNQDQTPILANLLPQKSHIAKKHSKFECNRLHYNPIVQKVIFKYLHDVKNTKFQRMKMRRQRKPYTGKSSSVLINYKLYTSAYDAINDWIRVSDLECEDDFSFNNSINYNIVIPSQSNTNKHLSAANIRRQSNNDKDKTSIGRMKSRQSRISINHRDFINENGGSANNQNGKNLQNMNSFQMNDLMSLANIQAKSGDNHKCHLSPNKYIDSNRHVRVPGSILSKKLTNMVVEKQILQNFWTVETDSAYDFKYYMTASNPKHISINHNKPKSVMTYKRIMSGSKF